jgi:hypothetical protein
MLSLVVQAELIQDFRGCYSISFGEMNNCSFQPSSRVASRLMPAAIWLLSVIGESRCEEIEDGWRGGWKEVEVSFSVDARYQYDTPCKVGPPTTISSVDASTKRGNS